MSDSPTPILQLALPSPLRRTFDYLPPESKHSAEFKIGTRFLVPFGNRQLVGLLVGVAEQSPFLDKLRPALSCLDDEPVLPSALVELAIWATRYYQYPIGDGVLSFLPGLIRKGEPAALRPELRWVIDDSVVVEKLTVKQQGLYELLQMQSQGLSTERIKREGFSRGILKALQDKALVTQREFAPDFIACQPSAAEILNEAVLPLNDEQHSALATLVEHINVFQCSLLQGVTGSGKTEVYLQLIQAVLEQGKQALVMVPEIGLTPQTVGRFQQRFSVPVVVMHSGMTDRERLDAWVMMKSGQARILIGTRSAVLTPCKALGVIIIDEEHDGSFKQQEGFRYSARDIAIMRARDEGVPIVLGSATPSLESFQNAQQGRYGWLQLNERAGGASMPRFRLLDVRQEVLHEGLSDELIDALRSRLQQGEQVMVFLNRRGFAPTLMCHDCGWLADCRHCDARYTLHRFPAHLHCHHCDHQQPIPLACPKCQSRNLQPLGSGTERVEAALERAFADVPVIRVDRDSTRRKNAMKDILAQIHQAGPCILLGTQMLAKGHHFPRVTLVAILDADAGLFSADFRGMEKTAQLILQVAGRAGRSGQTGEVIMQTHCADHPRLAAMVEQNYTEFAEAELTLREQGNLPPFINLALIRAEAISVGRAEAFLQVIREVLQSLELPSIELIGPMPSPMEKRAGRFRAQLLLQSKQRSSLQRVCSQLAHLMENNKQAKKVRWSIDIDPLDMF